MRQVAEEMEYKQASFLEYLATKAEESVELPIFSINLVLRVANRIERMGGRI